jgi:division protein CdvB (Snf7/Vps24/ESCRT-III family)
MEMANYTFDVEYDPIDNTYSVTAFDAETDEVVGEYYGLEDVDEVINTLVDEFGVTPDDEMIDNIMQLAADSEEDADNFDDEDEE